MKEVNDLKEKAYSKIESISRQVRELANFYDIDGVKEAASLLEAAASNLSAIDLDDYIVK